MPMSTVVPAGIFPDLPDCSRESAQNNLGMTKEILNLGTYKQIGKIARFGGNFGIFPVLFPVIEENFQK